mmetsp:Transcript_118098/g.376529  ORF Transcript_118098/g.376529 Transcript_118098/m.376529 type:complete len:272 (-) Transcript_118098:1080-1895(-)
MWPQDVPRSRVRGGLQRKEPRLMQAAGHPDETVLAIGQAHRSQVAVRAGGEKREHDVVSFVPGAEQEGPHAAGEQDVSAHVGRIARIPTVALLRHDIHRACGDGAGGGAPRRDARGVHAELRSAPLDEAHRGFGVVHSAAHRADAGETSRRVCQQPVVDVEYHKAMLGQPLAFLFNDAAYISCAELEGSSVHHDHRRPQRPAAVAGAVPRATDVSFRRVDIQVQIHHLVEERGSAVDEIELSVDLFGSKVDFTIGTCAGRLGQAIVHKPGL